MVEMVYGERPAGKGGFGGGGGGGFGGPGGGTSTRPNAANYGGQAANIQDQQGAEQPRVRRRLQVDRRRRNLDAHQQRQPAADVLQPDPRRSDRRQAISTCWASRSPSHATAARRSSSRQRGIHADQHALWIDPKDGRHMIIGTDGGFYVTYDRGQNWDHLNHMALGQFYHVAVCNKKPYWVYGGLQDNGSWGGPSMGLRGPGRSTRTGSRSTAATASSAASIPTIRIRSIREPGRRHGPLQPADRRTRVDQARSAWRSRRAVGGGAAAARSSGGRTLPLQLEHAVHPVEPQLAHLLLRRQLRLQVA